MSFDLRSLECDGEAAEPQSASSSLEQVGEMVSLKCMKRKCMKRRIFTRGASGTPGQDAFIQ